MKQRGKMKRKTNLIKFAALLICLLSLTLTGAAQKRKPVRKTTAKPAAQTTANAAAQSAANAAEIKDSATKVSTQLKNVSKFVYLLGGIAQGIEDVDKDIQSGKASRATADQNAKNKQAVISTLSNLRAGLTALEDDFRTKNSLRIYEINITGITELSAQAQDQATTGQIKSSGKTLLLIIEKLSDTLAAMP
jgi:hypothetical protein